MTKIYLSTTDKKIAGVCGGIAQAFDIDSSLVRIGVIFLALVTAIVPVVLTYILAIFILEEPTPPTSGNSKVYEASPDGTIK